MCPGNKSKHGNICDILYTEKMREGEGERKRETKETLRMPIVGSLL